ncbi:MAG: DUF3147 family protein [Candidatus Peregrinibacteria bacterium]
MFTAQLITSFIAGGFFIALQTLISERVPNKWKGIILTIPSTMSLGLLFIGLSKFPLDAAEAAIMIPTSTAISYSFVTLFALTITLGLISAFALSLTLWALLAYLFLTFPPENFLISILYEIPVIAVTYFLVHKLPKIPKLKIFPMNFKHITVRAIIGGTIIALAVFLSKTLGNSWGGLFSAFPAVFSSTFIIYYYLQGPRAIPSVAKSFFFPGIIGFNIYAYIASLTFPLYGIWIGTLASYLATFAFFCVWNITQKS